MFIYCMSSHGESNAHRVIFSCINVFQGYKDKHHKDEDKKVNEFYSKHKKYGDESKYGHHTHRVYHHVEDLDKGNHKKVSNSVG